MKARVLSGIDNLSSVENILRGKRIGLVTNPSGIDRQGNTTIDILNAKYDLVSMYAPEHGVRGDAQAGAHVDTYVDSSTGKTVYSLYGQHRYLTEEVVKGVEVMVFDIQDAGVRFYTYLYTLAYVMQGCAQFGIPLVLLDRVNPLRGDVTEGTVLDEAFHSFVGEYAMPTRQGLTVAEFAQWINAEKGIACELHIAPLVGWRRDMFYDDTDLPYVIPSPNVNSLESNILYVGGCIFEGCNVSEGRGTTLPFHLYGAPWVKRDKLVAAMRDLNLPGVMFRGASFNPTFSKHKGEICHGLQMHITDRMAIRPFETGLRLMEAIINLHPKDFSFTTGDSLGVPGHLNRLLGTDAFTEGRLDATGLIHEHQPQVKKFVENTKKYWLY